MSSDARSRSLDLEAARRGDVLEVDAAEAGSDRLDRRDDRVGILRVEADRPGVDAAELLEEQRLALHHGHRRLGPDVAEPEHRAAVGDDGDGVRLIVRFHDALGIVGDRLGRRARRPACTPSSRSSRVFTGAFDVHVDLAAEVQQERAVGDVLDLTPGDRRGRPRRSRSAWAPSVASTLTSRIFASGLDAHEIDRVEQPARVRDRAREIGEAAGPCRRGAPAA